MKKDFSCIGKKEKTAITYGFGSIVPNILHLQEGTFQNNEIITVLKEKYTEHVDFVIQKSEMWGENYCQVDFYSSFDETKTNELVSLLEELLYSTNGIQTRLSFRCRYDEQLVNEYARQFIAANENNKIMWNGLRCRILSGHEYNNGCVSAFVMKPKARKKGFHLLNTDVCFLGIENGFVGSLS